MARPPQDATVPRARQRGAALLLFALAGLILGITFFFSFAPNPDRTGRAPITADAMAQARAAVIGYAATYRDTHAGESFGFLPCPDTNNDGEAEANCGAANDSVVGRLPWKTLGLPPLRDADGECLWYAVSGRAKYNPKTAEYNWDTLGQFIVQDKSVPAVTLAGAQPHDQPLALIFSPGPPRAGQNRATAGGTECGGNDTLGEYLDEIGALGAANTVVALATPESILAGTNNDRAVWVTSADVFSAVRRRTDFKNAVETLLNDIALCLNGKTQATLASAALDPAGSKGADNLVAFVTNAANNCSTYATATSAKRKFLDHWKNNLLYARMAPGDVTSAGSSFTVAGQTGCKATLVFAGERAAGQTRHDAAAIGTLANYLEAMLPTFPAGFVVPNGAALGGASIYNAAAPATDLGACIRGLPAGATQASFASNFGNFATAGAGGAAAADSTAQTLTLLDASGTTGGCFWYADPIPLAGRTLRSFYRFRFATGDDLDPTTPDLRYGFTLQLVKGDEGLPIGCGTEFNSGALGPTATVVAPGTWGGRSFIIETDIYESSSRNDPSENHTAIMKNGSIDHAAFGDNKFAAAGLLCNGSSNLCRHTPANKFEELPAPLTHSQRTEITTGCNAGCTSCNPAAHATPNTYAQVTVWVDCSDCSDVSAPLNRVAQAPTVQICSDLDASMNSIYFGFTGGFSSTYPNPVTISDFALRSE